MVISLDYDNTYTRDPLFWDKFLIDCYAVGHKTYCVTMRSEAEGDDVKKALAGKVDDIIFTNRRAKQPTVQALRINIDVWIDDTPFFVDNDAIPKTI